MNRLIEYIQRRLSLRLGLAIVFVITVAFALLFGYLFYRSKSYVQRAAIDRATQLLDNTAERINGIMDETETVTNYMAQITPRHLHPDSLLIFTRRTVKENPFLTGFAISMEPDFFPQMGRYFSAYSLRYWPDDTDSTAVDSITTVREEPFEYFDAVWYKTPRTLGKACWVDAYDDYNEGTLSSPDYLTSYCCPMRDANGRYIGSITASLTLKWLSEACTALKPYPNSSAIMLDRNGTYIVHPDTSKLFSENIFSDAAPEARHQIETMGKAMISGNSGMTETTVDGNDAFIFYRPLQRNGWSIAIVCPESDVFARYDHLFVIVWVIIAIGLMLLMLFCYQTVRRAAQPLSQLDHAVRRIADGHFDESLPESSRRDSVGRLTNSFISMQQSLAESVADIQRVNDELQQKNDELATAYQLKMETNRKKTLFIRDMYHEIRTPLNIINGFTQVLSGMFHEIPDNELTDITSRMKSSAEAISHLTRMLAASVTTSILPTTRTSSSQSQPKQKK
ncbi:MAG: HAMP domain-containing protein [Prevotella sp.]|nr:HAMP domain-containing protein [Prevotella sp.]